MDLRPVLYLFMWVVMAVIADTSSQDKISSYDEPAMDDGTLESLLAYDEPSKRGTMLRYGRGSIFRFGKRPSNFRYGKRGTMFRFGKREDDSVYDQEEEAKRGMLFRYGKRFARDTKRQKVHKPFHFGRRMEDDEI